MLFELKSSELSPWAALWLDFTPAILILHFQPPHQLIPAASRRKLGLISSTGLVLPLGGSDGVVGKQLRLGGGLGRDLR